MLGTQSAVNPPQYPQGYECKYHQVFLEGSLELCVEIRVVNNQPQSATIGLL